MDGDFLKCCECGYIGTDVIIVIAGMDQRELYCKNCIEKGNKRIRKNEQSLK